MNYDIYLFLFFIFFLYCAFWSEKEKYIDIELVLEVFEVFQVHFVMAENNIWNMFNFINKGLIFNFHYLFQPSIFNIFHRLYKSTI